MSRLLRTPTNSGLHQTLSDSDVTYITPEIIASPSLVSQRNKRHRQSSEERFASFKEEIKAMLDVWKESQNTLLNKLISEVAEIKRQNTVIQQTNEEIEKSLVFINQQYEDMKQKVETLETERKQHLLKIACLELAIEEVQRNSKLTTIELRNVPTSTETENKQDLCNIVHNTCKKLNVMVQESTIRDVFRVKTKTGKGTIVAELSSTMLKSNILHKAKLYNKNHPMQRLNSEDIGLKGELTPIYISEALTNKGRKLFYLARNFAKSKEYQFCWTSNGKIFIRKDTETPRIEIRDEQQLSTLGKSL